MPGYATPAANYLRQTLWTATPVDTPLFDKRLLNVATDKPCALSLNGQVFHSISLQQAIIDCKGTETWQIIFVCL